MNGTLKTARAARLVLDAATAADLMTTNPISIRDAAFIQEAIAVLTDKGVSAAPVIDEAGRPVGVVSTTDLLVHKREHFEYAPDVPEFYGRPDLENTGGPLREVVVDRTQVRDIMTPIVFSVAPDAPAAKVVEELRSLRVHRIFVVDDAGVLVGVISTTDVLRHLKLEENEF